MDKARVRVWNYQTRQFHVSPWMREDEASTILRHEYHRGCEYVGIEYEGSKGQWTTEGLGRTYNSQPPD